MKTLSDSEVEYIVRSCSLGMRNDGRSLLDYRNILVESDIFPHCAGSSRVTIGSAADVICGVKVSVSESGADNNDYIDSSVEFSPSCNLKMSEKAVAKYSFHIAEIIKSSVRNNCSSFFPNLVIIPGKFYWKIHIDLLVLQTDGNSIDACSFATYNALKCTRIPKTEVFIGESGRPEDFEVSGDVVDAMPFEPPSIPLCVTITKIDKSVFILDATMSEEACARASVTVAVSCDGSTDQGVPAPFKLCGMYKNGAGSFSPEELLIVMNHARLAGASIVPHLDQVHTITDEDDRKYPDHPPSRVGLLA
mmetsp:Transcript_11457/g.18687  ORF Transcript_11457/g.18687 Transcript_11457/m.18687 type:complete len:306 (-) Transcript_11457:94-1011(-)|eukprot:CAMPEP_0114424358 /NCGR_PEP_ID=MMETSP0103-20121206/6650_1 /TAXON_ID=37642 ORGANISM="Paraphysomonas imperforata, Strain PA2" /NCGR_SAMPLE_ID=MMETSP0103 /ASSEMBLY_ACC=CAM_ASM_000201 /LENGTH=305 /DNA_ID=CAMNT_0001593103 /DNA_START=73 /DNA_END=990 /DNA_ORIENTATION=+